MAAKAPWRRIRRIDMFERRVPFRLPFRFGVVELRDARQAIVRVIVEGLDGRVAVGCAAELLAAKWFDKDPARTFDDNYDQLRRSLRLAGDVYGAASPMPLFALSLEAGAEVRRRAAEGGGMPALSAGFGPALLDRALLDALCRLEGATLPLAVEGNLMGFEPGGLLPGAEATWTADFLAARLTPSRVKIRHTVGGIDPLVDSDVAADRRPPDGRPVSLEESVRAYGFTRFKVAAVGSVEEMVDRLERVAAVLDRCVGRYAVTVDCSEQVPHPDALARFVEDLARRPGLAGFRASLVYVEQPFDRAATWRHDLGALAGRLRFLVDEADDALDAFERARALGYRGISFKGCKGIYKGLLNAARVALWSKRDGADLLLSAEDLTCLPGLSLNQDMAFAALLGVADNQRNAYHYVSGLDFAPPAERRALAAVHTDLYGPSATGLQVADGAVSVGSLWRQIGFASAPIPRLDDLPSLAAPIRSQPTGTPERDVSRRR